MKRKYETLEIRDLSIAQEASILAGSPTEVPMVTSKKVQIEDMTEEFLDIEFKVQ